MSRFSELLLKETASFISLDSKQLELLEAHCSLLERWNWRLNLTAVRDHDEAVRVHYGESLFLASVLPSLPAWSSIRDIADVGSGAGFPGFPIAVAHPDRQVQLIDSHARKAVFLHESSQSVPNVKVSSARFEDLAGPWDLVVSRAVAWREIADKARASATAVAILVGDGDVSAVQSSFGWDWMPPVLVPWPRRGCVLVGVPRET
jgi:16S rRNA (guanine527-N7)-methyltransferase